MGMDLSSCALCQAALILKNTRCTAHSNLRNEVWVLDCSGRKQQSRTYPDTIGAIRLTGTEQAGRLLALAIVLGGWPRAAALECCCPFAWMIDSRLWCAAGRRN